MNTHGAARDRGRRRRSRGRRDGRVHAARTCPVRRCATTCDRWRSPSRRGRRSRCDGNLLGGSAGRCGSASTTARASSCTRSRYDDGGPRRPVAHRHLVRRDGRPVPRPDRRPLPADRVRHRRVGPRLHDAPRSSSAATASARSATSTRWCTTTAASRGRSRTRSASTRRTTRSSGSTSTPRGAEVRRMRRLVVSFHATVANYEYLVYWRFYQDGNIECEVRATGHHGHDGLRRGRAGTARHARRRAHLRAVPPALHRRPARPGRRRRAEHRRRDATPRCRRSARTTRTGSPCVQRNTPLRHRARGAPGLRLGDAARLEGASTRAGRTRLGAPVAYKLVPGGAFPPMLDPASPVVPAGRGDRPHALGDALPRGRALAGGEYPDQSADDTGLPVWTAQRPVDREHRRRALVRVRHPPHHARRRTGR